MKKVLKKLFAPAIVLLLVVAMGVFSPVVSVAAALRLSIASDPGVNSSATYNIENLPARTVELGSVVTTLPSVTNSGLTKLWHAGRPVTLPAGNYTYPEVGQYEWRFYTAAPESVLFDTYTVTVTDTTYKMALPNNVVTVAPKGMSELKLPLPASYTIGGNTMEVDGDITFNSANHYAIVKLRKNKDEASTNYRLSASVSLENNTFADDKISFDSKNLKINLSSYQNSTGNLKVTYFLRKDDSSNKLLAATPLNDIEIKNVQKGDVTFANIPTAPSVSNLSYYSNVTLTAPTADSAKVDKSTSFTVEAQTSIVKVQAYLYPTEPNWSKDSKVRNLTVDENGVVKEGNNVVNDIIEIDGLNVKVKALGYYRFQFQTSTLFGYKMDSDFDNYDAIEQDSNKTYVRYWSDSVQIRTDSVKPNFAWMKEDYDTANATRINEISENFSEYLNDCEKYLPMTEKPNASTEKKVTVNFNSGLTVPAIFPHDNATAFDDMIDTVTVTISQDNDDEGRTSNDGATLNSSVYSGTSNTSTTFEYNPRKHMNIKFVTNGINGGNQSENEITLKSIAGLYHVTITVTEKQPVFKGNNEKYSGGYAQSETKTLYFYVDGDYDNTTAANSPKIDENDAFKVSDVYLWEGRTFDFSAPSFNDEHTAKNNLQIDYYLVCENSGNYVAVAKLDYTTNASRINVDLNKLEYVQGNTLNITDYTSLATHFNDTFYIYAVARNFNGMQADLKNSYAPANGLVETHFSTGLFNVGSLKDNAKVAQNGYAWKRAGFKIHAVDNAKVATVAAEVPTVGNDFVAKKNIKITGVSASWGLDVVDGQLSVAVYRVKDNALIPVDVRNGSATNAPVVSSIAFNRKSQAFDSDLYFTPSVSGEYILVVTAKDNASDKIFSKVTKITIDHSDDYDVRPTDTNNSDTVNETIDLGESLTLPSFDITLNKEVVYKAKNRLVFKASDGSEIGYYTVTVLGTNDTNCVTGNKFVPNNYGKYKFQYKFYDAKNTPDDANDDVLLKTKDYVVRVNEAEGSSNILMGEDYDTDTDRILWAVTETNNGEQTYIVDGQTYHAGINDTNTKTKPAYAITLPQFVMSNYGAANDFVVDSADLFKYLEPEYDTANNKIKGYMYPAIAIPMPNVIADETSSDEVEITVQKSGKTKYLVSTKKMNAGNSTNKASELDKIQDFYVFRPEGVFSADCRTAYNENNYLQTADSKSGASGVYTVTYKTSTSSVSYNITIGNLKNGQVDWKENFLTYDNGDGAKAITDASDKLIIEKDKDGHRYVTIDMSKVFFTGNDDMLSLIAQGPNGDQNNTTGYASNDHAKEYYWKNVSVTVSYDNGSFIDYDDWSEASSETKMIKDHENFKYKFDLTQGSGTYKVTIRMTNSYTASPVTKSIEFTLDAEATNKNVNLNTVWGIILIVLSVGLLGGVIFYFVRTARVTRFVDAPRAMKSREKNKTTKPVAAPKDVEAPKDDVK